MRRWDHSSRYPYVRRRNREAHQRQHCGHKAYHLTCEEFGALEQDSGARCGICHTALDVTTLCTDHDHAVVHPHRLAAEPRADLLPADGPLAGILGDEGPAIELVRDGRARRSNDRADLAALSSAVLHLAGISAWK